MGTGDDSLTALTAREVGFLRIDTGVGSDHVLIDLAAVSWIRGLAIDTGVGDDSVLLRAGSDGQLPYIDGTLAFIETHQGNDIVQFEGTFGLAGSGFLHVQLGEGDDTLIGDSESDPLLGIVSASGGQGNDTVLNATYFHPLIFLSLFDVIDD